MLHIFKPRLSIDADEFDWMLACFRWLSLEYGIAREPKASALTLPDETTFPRSRAQGHERAAELFDIVRRRADMAEWPCELIAGAAERPVSVATGIALQHEKHAPAGTFVRNGDRYWITYNPIALQRPQDLVATFAHELSHYLLHTAHTASPGGRDLHEHLTDLTAVYLGFGIFMANSAKNFSQFQTASEQGWQMRRQGYLSELSLITALAIFVRLAGAESTDAEQELKAYLRAPFRRTLRALDRLHPDLPASIDVIDLSQWQPEDSLHS